MREDNWWIVGPENKETFFDITFYNQDTYYVNSSNTLLTEIYFRFQNDQMMHYRSVFDFTEWLGQIGGIHEILITFMSFLIGSYVQFYAGIKKIRSLY